MDPRTSVVGERLKDVKKIVAVCAGKGGVGKSTISCLLALAYSRKGLKVGLLDLDFHGPSTHVILGVSGVFPEEEHGIVPPTVDGIKHMSITYYAGEEPVTLRGEAVSDSIIELFAITQWGKLDVLFIDMPPGLGEPTLDTLRLIEEAEFLLVTTGSKVSLDVVNKLARLLCDQEKRILGAVVNMKRVGSDPTKLDEVDTVSELRYDPGLEEAVGDPVKLLKTQAANDLAVSVENGVISGIKGE